MLKLLIGLGAVVISLGLFFGIIYLLGYIAHLIEDPQCGQSSHLSFGEKVDEYMTTGFMVLVFIGCIAVILLTAYVIGSKFLS